MPGAFQQLVGVVLWYNKMIGEGRIKANDQEYEIRAPLQFADDVTFYIVAGDRVSFRARPEKFWEVSNLKLLNRAPTIEHGNST